MIQPKLPGTVEENMEKKYFALPTVVPPLSVSKPAFNNNNVHTKLILLSVNLLNLNFVSCLHLMVSKPLYTSLNHFHEVRAKIFYAPHEKGDRFFEVFLMKRY